MRFVGILIVLSFLSTAARSDAAPTLRIAVAPFAVAQNTAGAGASLVATALATQFAGRSLERVIAPGEFVAEPLFEPRSSEVRQWAYNSAVDTLVVGRVFRQDGSVGDGSRVIEASVRSGHSGAEISRHVVVVPIDADLDAAVGRLATLILDDLGYVGMPPTDARRDPLAPDLLGNADPTPAPRGSKDEDGSSDGRLDRVLTNVNFKGDAPIEIKADEAEIISREDGRKLIFQRNVWVRQDNVTLQSERLEASYRKGESQPRELIAEGLVRVVQNDRRAKCDRAIYLRDANRLTCIGRAELVQGCDIIRGESIEFDLAGDKARVEGAASIVIQQNKDAPTGCTESGETS